MDTKRNYLNYTEQLMPNFAATHTASVVLKRFFTKIKSGINATYSFATGRPYYYFLQDGTKFNLAEQGKTKDYNSLKPKRRICAISRQHQSKDLCGPLRQCQQCIGV